MPLKPDIDICIIDSCKKMRVRDITGVYATNNTGGWESPNIAGSAVTTATIKITFPDSTTQTETVTADRANTVAGEFDYSDISPDNFSTFPDGEYEILLTITDGTNTYKKKATFLTYCNIKACVDSYGAELADELCGCDFKDREDKINTYNTMYNMLTVLESCGACLNTTTRDNMLTNLEKLCDSENQCNCN